MMSMPTRPSAALSKPAARPPAAWRPPGPGWPAPLRWSASVALALGLPVVLALAAQRLGPGPHATLRIELALQPLDGGMGSGGMGARGDASHASEPRPAAPASPQPTAPLALLPAPPNEAAVPPVSAPMPDARVATPAALVSAAAPARTPEPPPVAAHLSPPIPRERLDASQPAPGPVARTASAGAWSAAGASATESRRAAPGVQAENGAETGSGAGTVHPEALDAGFGLASPVRLAYPPEALARAQGGRARIEVEIEPDGRVARVTVLEETGQAGFGSAARQAYSRARFTPPRMAGRAVRVVLRKTIEFEP